MLAVAFIIALLFSALAGTMLFGIVNAKPSVPEFTVKLVAHPYDVPTTYSTDPYTGENITHPGYHVENRSIEITIKNQPFTPYTDEEGNEVNLYYNVRIKGHYEEDWKALYSRYKGSSGYPVQSSSEHTVLSCSADYPYGAEVDFQVEALVGHYYDEMAGRPIIPLYVLIVDESSGWSDTQTLAIGERQTPTPSLLPPELGNIIVGMAIVALVFGVALGFLIYFKRKKIKF